MNSMKTTLLLATLTAILVVLGDMIGGRTGMMAMFVVSMGMILCPIGLAIKSY